MPVPGHREVEVEVETEKQRKEQMLEHVTRVTRITQYIVYGFQLIRWGTNLAQCGSEKAMKNLLWPDGSLATWYMPAMHV